MLSFKNKIFSKFLVFQMVSTFLWEWLLDYKILFCVDRNAQSSFWDPLVTILDFEGAAVLRWPSFTGAAWLVFSIKSYQKQTTEQNEITLVPATN